MSGQDVPSTLRAFDPKTDVEAVLRIWREVGWAKGDEVRVELERYLVGGSSWVGALNETPECLVHTTPGTMRLVDKDLPLCAVTAVATSRVARGHGLALRLTARQLAAGARSGAVVAALGIFDQGFYDKLGFGTGAYAHWVTFDPSTLLVDRAPRTPSRFGLEDASDLHDAMVQRSRGHGGVALLSAETFRGELGFEGEGFGLGYRNAKGEVTHFLWFVPEGENGPYEVNHYAYRTMDQFIELLALIRSLSDQVYSVSMFEPGDIQFQTLLKRPFRRMDLTKGGDHANHIRTLAWWQLRVLDVQACVAALPGCVVPLRFNLSVSDPVGAWLDEGDQWSGVSGEYVVELGSTCAADLGVAVGLPTLRCSVGALSRLLWGVSPAGSLSVTDEFHADPDLLAALDRSLSLPQPNLGWDL